VTYSRYLSFLRSMIPVTSQMLFFTITHFVVSSSYYLTLSLSLLPIGAT
jgi:hypothetical protein